MIKKLEESNLTENDYLKISRVAKRAKKIDPLKDYLTIVMDIECCYQDIDIDKLLSFDEFNFIHDVFGIYNHINRKTGELENCFLPRCSK